MKPLVEHRLTLLPTASQVPAPSSRGAALAELPSAEQQAQAAEHAQAAEKASMAEQLVAAEQRLAARSASAGELISTPGARPFQFGVRSLLLATTLIALVLGVLSHLHPTTAVIVAWSLILVGGHVLGNAWVKKSAPYLPPEPRESADGAVSGLRPSDTPSFSRPTRLRKSHRLGWFTRIMIVVGACAGAAIGMLGLASNYLDQIGYGGLIFGSCATATLGGIVGFVVSSFVGVGWLAWNEASRHRD